MKPHIYDTVGFLSEGSSCVANCGAEIKKARLITFGESDFIPGEVGAEFRSGKECTKCLKSPNKLEGTYRKYLIYEGEE